MKFQIVSEFFIRKVDKDEGMLLLKYAHATVI